MKQPEFYPIQPVPDGQLKFAVIAARYQGKWIFCRHRERATWEIPGGHVEPGETPLEAARRELYEETGATDADISVVGTYRLYDYGLLCFAEIHSLGPIPADSEIAEIQSFDTPPRDLTYGEVHAQLHKWVQGWLNTQSGAGEIWDIYDENRNLTGRTHRRGDPLQPGDYHLTVQVWMRNSEGKYLLTKRSPNKGFPNLWETTGGSALVGDDSLTAALREVKEETGLDLRPEYGRIVLQNSGRDFHEDVWLFHQDFRLCDVLLLEGETCDVMYATGDEILEMLDDGRFVPLDHVRKLVKISATDG